jgi:hypothetical protein
VGGQWAKRAVPMAVVIVATGEGTGGPNDINANEQDDYEYKLGTIALPLQEPSGRLGLAAVATPVETERLRPERRRDLRQRCQVRT